MAFVEFDDVHYASRAITELYGHTLGGIVKGGIRLSYSKSRSVHLILHPQVPYAECYMALQAKTLWVSARPDPPATRAPAQPLLVRYHHPVWDPAPMQCSHFRPRRHPLRVRNRLCRGPAPVRGGCRRPRLPGSRPLRSGPFLHRLPLGSRQVSPAEGKVSLRSR